MPPLLFGRHDVSDRSSGSNFVTSALPGCFAGMLHVLSLIFLVSYSMYLIGLLRIALLNAGVKLISLTREYIPFLVCIYLLKGACSLCLFKEVCSLCFLVQQDSLAFGLFKGVCSLCLTMSVFMYC